MQAQDQKPVDIEVVLEQKQISLESKQQQIKQKKRQDLLIFDVDAEEQKNKHEEQEKQSIVDIKQYMNGNKENNQHIPISQQQITLKLTQITIDNTNVDTKNDKNKKISKKLSQAFIINNSSSQNEKQQLIPKQLIEYLQNEPERGYIESIQQIKQILNDKQLSKIKFIKTMLKDFSPFVFGIKNNKQSQKQYDPFDSEVSFDLNGLVVQKQQKQKQDQTQNSKVIIDKHFFDTTWIENVSKNKMLKKLIKYNPIFHCRMVFILYALMSEKHYLQKAYNINLSEDMITLKKKLQQKSIRCSFDENIWTQQRQSTLKNLTKNGQYAFKQLGKDKFFKKVDNFYTIFGFKDPNHPFNRKMKILNQQMYRIRYIKQFSYYSFSTKQEIFNFLKVQKSQRFKNIQFYCNKVHATTRRLTLGQIHSHKATDYEWLQRSHDYIQWLFPNHFTSQFNSSSFPLGYIEAQIFKNDVQLRKLLLRSFQIFIDFMGCKIFENQIPIIPESVKKQIIKQKNIIIQYPNQKRQISRLKDCLIYNTHNHLRIMRILACLSVTGLRNYAAAFLSFLNRLKSNKHIDFSCIQSSLQKNWNIYSSQPEKKFKALQMCFIPYQNFPQIKFQENPKNKSQNNIKVQMDEQNDHGKKKTKLHSCGKTK